MKRGRGTTPSSITLTQSSPVPVLPGELGVTWNTPSLAAAPALLQGRPSLQVCPHVTGTCCLPEMVLVEAWELGLLSCSEVCVSREPAPNPALVQE